MVRKVLILSLCVLAGCRAPGKQSAEPSQKAVISAVAETVRTTLQQEVTQVQNQIWPWVIYLLVTGVSGITAATILVWYWIRSNSYLKQKPKWEACKPFPFLEKP